MAAHDGHGPPGASGAGGRRLATILPKEHGTWAMLLVPWATGCGLAPRLEAPDLLLLPALLGAFLAHTQVMRWARLGLRPDPGAVAGSRRLAAGLAGLAALGALPLVVLRQRVGLLVFVGLGVALTGASVLLVRARRDRALAGQILAAAALSLAAPAAYHVGGGALGATAGGLWLLNALFFLGAVLYVRLKIAALARRSAGWPAAERLRFAAGTMALDAAVLAAAAAALHAGGLSPAALLAFAPTAVQTVVGVLALHRPVRLKRLGLLATGHAIVFAALVIWLA